MSYIEEYQAEETEDGTWVVELDIVSTGDPADAAAQRLATTTDQVTARDNTSWNLVTEVGPAGGAPIYRFETPDRESMEYLLTRYDGQNF